MEIPSCLPKIFQFSIFFSVISRNPTGTSGLEDPGLGIVEGKPAQISDFPYQVSILKWNGKWEHSCGGTILSPTVVATVASCIQDHNFDPNYYFVLAGSTDNTDYDEASQLRSIAFFRIPSSYDRNTLKNNAALLNLKIPLYFNQNIQSIPVCKKRPTEGWVCDATGWGTEHSEENSNQAPHKLRHVELRTLSVSSCRWYWGQTDDSQVCVTSARGLGGFCRGDEGGPLVCTHSGEKCLLGAASHFAECGSSDGLPDIFTNVIHFKNIYPQGG